MMNVFKRGENLFSFKLKFSDWISTPRANPYLLRRKIKEMATE